VSIQAVGQLVTIFALTYAVSSPILTALTGAFNRRKLLLLAMAAFTGANIVAAQANGYWPLVLARVLLAISAGLYVPSASALAGSLVSPERRGRALAIVLGGFSLAVALGVPLGAIIGNHFGWRMTFASVAGLGLVAFIGLLLGIPRSAGSGLAAATLRERAAIARQPGAFPALLVTTLWGMGGYSVYTYIAPYLAQVVGFQGEHVGYAIFLWGAAALVGLLSGGALVDRFGTKRVIETALPITALALISLTASARYLGMSAALIPVLIGIVVWGVSAWGFFPAQQARMIGLVGVKNAPVILSLNASFQYLGFSMGAALGSVVLTQGSVADLGWVGALCVTSAYLLFLFNNRRAAA
jgi:predicted MFS family arabinose efflux permease